jgi:hypothetical protein
MPERTSKLLFNLTGGIYSSAMRDYGKSKPSLVVEHLDPESLVRLQ